MIFFRKKIIKTENEKLQLIKKTDCGPLMSYA